MAAIIAFSDSDRHEDLNASWHQRDALCLALFDDCFVLTASHLASWALIISILSTLEAQSTCSHIQIQWVSCDMTFMSWPKTKHLSRLRVSWYRPDLRSSHMYLFQGRLDKTSDWTNANGKSLCFAVLIQVHGGFWWLDVTGVVKSLCLFRASLVGKCVDWELSAVSKSIQRCSQSRRSVTGPLFSALAIQSAATASHLEAPAV